MTAVEKNKNFFDRITADTIHVNFAYDVILRGLLIIAILINLFGLFRFIDYLNSLILWGIFTVLLFINTYRRKRNNEFGDMRNARIFLSSYTLLAIFQVVPVLFEGYTIFIYIGTVIFLLVSITLFVANYAKDRQNELFEKYDMRN